MLPALLVSKNQWIKNEWPPVKPPAAYTKQTQEKNRMSRLA
jgi:hypothetical protein